MFRTLISSQIIIIQLLKINTLYYSKESLEKLSPLCFNYRVIVLNMKKHKLSQNLNMRVQNYALF